MAVTLLRGNQNKASGLLKITATTVPSLKYLTIIRENSYL
jgi:hypothetical protein